MSTRRPNIVFICTDQQRYDSLGCTGNRCADTPHLDALARSGTVCRRYFSGNSICMPSRAMLLTGKYPTEHGVWTNGVPLARRGYFPETSVEGGGLRPGQSAMSEVPTLADALAAQGYRTASIGKLHLTPTQSHPSFRFEECRQRWLDEPALADWHGPYYGFQHVEFSIGHGEDVHGHYGHWLEHNFPGLRQRIHEAQRNAPRPFPDVRQLYRGAHTVASHPTTWCGERAAAYIGSATEPYFLWVGIPDPHHPFTPPAESCAEFEQRDTMLSSCPATVDKPAALRRYLRPDSGWQCPPAAQRLIRQYTDAMNHLTDRAVGRIAAALKAAGQWDNTIIIFTSDHGDYLGDFGLLYKTSHASAALQHVPFIVRGLVVRSDQPLGGADVAPWLLGTARRDWLPMGQDFPAEAYERNLTIYDERYRYTWYPGTGERELYDHAADPHELRNLAGNPMAMELHARLVEQTAQVASPMAARVAIW